MTDSKRPTPTYGPFGLSYGDIGLLSVLILVLAVGLVLLFPRQASEPAPLAGVTSTPSPAQPEEATPAGTSTLQPTDTPPTPALTPTEAPTEPAPSKKVATSAPTPTRSPSPTPVEETPTPPPAAATAMEAVDLKATSTPPPPTATPTPTTDTPTPIPTDAPASLPAPPTEALTGLIVFPVFDPAARTYNIYAARPDGSERRLVAPEASQPTLNSKGERIAYRSWAQNRGLIEQGIMGEQGWQFNFYGEAARPVFSPDDQIFLFQSREGGEQFAVYRTVGEGYEVLRRGGFPIEGEAPAWTPDGRFIYKGWLDSAQGLILSNLDGISPTLITHHGSDTDPAVSPNGGSVVFMSERHGDWDVFKVGIDGTGLTQLTTDPADDGLPTWSPDGQTIAFVSERSDEWAMWAMNADGSNQRLLFKLDGSIDGVVQVDVQNSYGWLEERIDWAP